MAKKASATGTPKRLCKSRKDKMIDGVCAGFADYFSLDITLVRVVWALSLFVHGFGLVAYLAAMVIMPKNPDHETLPEEEKSKHHPGYIWGVGLILLGLLILTDGWDRVRPWDGYPHWGPWGSWGFDAHLLLPVLILSAGVVYVIYSLKHKEPAGESVVEPSASDRPPLRRHKTDRWIAGVLSGLAAYLHVDVVLVRIVFAALALATHLFFFVLVYVGLWVAVPESQSE